MSEREYYRHSQDGQRGYLVMKDGEKHIQLDRPNQEIIVPYNVASWIPVHEERPVSRMEAAQVAFAADRILCRILGFHLEAKKDWLSLKEEDRRAWMDGTIGLTQHRRLLYRHIQKALERLTRTP